MATANRENRRRKIVDGGANRLALITGQIRENSLPGTQPEHELEPVSSPPSHSVHSTHQIHSFGDETSQNHECSSIDSGHVDGIAKASEHQYNESIQAMTASAPNHKMINQTIQTGNTLIDESDMQNSSIELLAASTNQNSTTPISVAEKCVEGDRQVTAKEITFAIAETKATRLFCSIVIAFGVVLSNWGFPLIGCYLIRSVLSFRPLYLVFLTNVTLVVAELRLNDLGGSEKLSKEEYDGATTGEVDWIERASNALEASFVVYNAIAALLLDFSAYAVIVICGLCFVQG